MRNPIYFLYFFQRQFMGEPDFKHMENECQGILSVWDYRIRENAVGMAAGAEGTGNAEDLTNDFSILEIHNIPVIVAMDPALANGITGWTTFL